MALRNRGTAVNRRRSGNAVLSPQEINYWSWFGRRMTTNRLGRSFNEGRLSIDERRTTRDEGRLLKDLWPPLKDPCNLVSILNLKLNFKSTDAQQSPVFDYLVTGAEHQPIHLVGFIRCGFGCAGCHLHTLQREVTRCMENYVINHEKLRE